MKTFRKYVVPLLLLTLLVGGVESVRSFFMSNVITPIALVFWAAWRVIASVDQNIYWIILITVCFLLVVRLVPNRNEGTLKGAYTYAYKAGNRVEYWQSLITDALSGREEAGDLRDAMKKLLVAVLRKTEEFRPIDLEKMVITGKIPLSQETQRFLFPASRSDGKSSASVRVTESLLNRARFRSKSGGKMLIDNGSIDEILKWIETEMEISNDK